jgi:AcrR family transcriptional regulator
MQKPRLSRSAIVATAIRMADEKGLAAVTLRGIAARLGVHVTSLYHHVPTKEAVLEAMVEELIAGAELPRRAGRWQDWLRSFAAALRALAREHPGAFEAFHHVPARGEPAVEALEAGLAALRADGFDAVTAGNAVRATSVAVLGLVLDDAARRRSGGQRGDFGALGDDRFPHVREFVRMAGDTDPFDYTIDVLVDGIAASLRRGSRGG